MMGMFGFDLGAIGEAGGFLAGRSAVWGYLDQGAGSYMLQTLAAGLFALIHLARQSWGRVRILVAPRSQP